LIEQAIELYRSLDDPAALAGAIKSLGNVASDRADYATARRLYEESLEIKIQVGAPLPPEERAAHKRRIDRVRRGLPEDRFEAAWAEGRALTLDEAVMRALS
jgi:hypothetical protein